MANEVTVFEGQLQALTPQFTDVLAVSGVAPARLIRTMVISCEKNPSLLQCNRQSLINSAMTAAVLGLEVDGVTGQAYLIPFANKVQLIVGYKGYNTMGARSGYTINSGSVREKDHLDFELGSSAFVSHKPQLGGEMDRKIIAAWATASHKNRPPIVRVLSIDEIMAIMRKSPGAKKKDSPWNDPSIGFPAMAEKSAKRRLARDMPLNVMQVASRMDEAFDEQGLSGHVTQGEGLIIEGKAQEVMSGSSTDEQPAVPDGPQEFVAVGGNDLVLRVPTIERWVSAWLKLLDKVDTMEKLEELKSQNQIYWDQYVQSHPDHFSTVAEAYGRKVVSLDPGGAAN